MMMSRDLVRVLVGAAAAVLVASCKDGSGPASLGPPSKLVLLPGSVLSAPANTLITTTIQLSVQDAANHPLPNETVTFAVSAGAGSLASFTATSDANGTVTVPSWRLGKSAIVQTITATIGSVVFPINAAVTTNFTIVVRFFGTAMTPAQQALFTNAAARISGFITGDIVNALATNQDLTQCNITGQPPLNEEIDDVIVYASIQDIDGPGKILAQAGPCLGRSGGTQNQFMPAVGAMQFDAADINNLTGGGSLQEVITHEMMHVLGFGVLWDDPPNRAFLSVPPDSIDPRFTGPQARQGCVSVGGTVTCALSVPVEGKPAQPGTILSHWRESTFDNELMTGFIDASPNPLSLVTIGSMADIGYTVNSADFDSYAIPGGLLRASVRASASPALTRIGWERALPIKTLLLLENGRARPWTPHLR